MVQLLQLNGELPEKFPGHERRLYIFACRKATCRRKQGSIRAVRGVKISKEAQAAAAKKAEAKPQKRVEEKEEPKKDVSSGLGTALFGGGSGAANPFGGNANPFSTGASSSSSPFGTAAPSNPFSKPAADEEPTPKKEEETKDQDPAASLPKTFAETLNLNNPHSTSGPPPPPEPWPAANALPKPYPISYLADAEFETLDPEPMPVPQNARMEVDTEGGSSSGGGDMKDVFESSMDAAFQKFADRMEQNPEQCIRYEFNGTPLLYSKADAVGAKLGAAGGGGMTRCGNCGARRVFEVQMTPHAITELEAEELSLEGMDWGTIIVGVCEADCQQRGVEIGEAGYLEEWCGVQWEELSKR